MSPSPPTAKSGERPPESVVRRFVKSLIKESDRGCALVGAAHLDRDLEKLLRHVLHGMSKAPKKDLDYLFNGAVAPLHSFSVRIRMAHALGLIPDPIRKTLNAIREIRNHFAHEEDAVDFPRNWIDLAGKFPLMGWVNEQGDVTEALEETEEIFKGIAANVKKVHPRASEMRIKLIWAVVWVRSYLTTRYPSVYPGYYPPEFYQCDS